MIAQTFNFTQNVKEKYTSSFWRLETLMKMKDMLVNAVAKWTIVEINFRLTEQFYPLQMIDFIVLIDRIILIIL